MASRSSGPTSPTIRRRVVVGLAALAVSALAGCSDSQGPGPNGTTSLSILLKDATGDLKNATVTITEIDLVGTGGTQVLMNTPVTTDLLTLASTTLTLVQGVQVPSGTYTELRFKMSGGCIAVDNSPSPDLIYATPGYDATPCGGTATGTLQMPSFGQSGLKVTMAGDALTLTEPQEILLVDFNVSQSFGHVAGQSGMWVMHPVVTGGKLGVSGSLHTTVQLGQGVTLPPDPNNNNAATTLDKFSVALVDANNNPVGSPLPLTLDNQGVGTADFFLEAGTYTLSLVPPQWIASVTTNPATPLTVTVTAGQTTNVTLTVTGAAAASGGT